eukprot:scaffold71314_cov36-Phaeocystis_antarctica.AAC.1
MRSRTVWGPACEPGVRGPCGVRALGRVHKVAAAEGLPAAPPHLGARRPVRRRPRRAAAPRHAAAPRRVA